jgi:PKD repeat protein
MKLHQFIKPFLLTVCVALSSLLHAQYTGGIASGSALESSIQSVCTSVIYPDMFKGGSEDGFEAVAVVQANCSPPAVPAIFSGGSDDGHSMALIHQVSCSPVVYPNIFAGGIEDGFALSGITQANCAPPLYPGIFTGGAEDGFAVFSLNQINCNPDPLPDIYSGGVDDGHAMVAMFTACAPFADFSADNTVICQGDTVHFSDLSLGSPLSWSWTFNGGDPASSSIQNPSVVYDTPGVYSVSLFVTSGTGNSSITKVDYITVNAVPVPIISASGSTTFCEGDSVQLTCSPAFSSYFWSNGAVTQNTFALTSGIYDVTVTAANGCQGVSNALGINVLSNPKPTVFTAGPSPACTGDTVMLTSSPAGSYLWSPGGQNTQNIAAVNSGTFWVSASYANGCSRISDPVSVSFGNTPAKPVITPSGPLSFCNGGSVTLISSPAPSYLWSPGGQTSQSVLITTSGTFYVEAIGASGCSSLSDPVTVTVLPQTPTPVITAGGPSHSAPEEVLSLHQVRLHRICGHRVDKPLSLSLSPLQEHTLFRPTMGRDVQLSRCLLQ